MNRSDLIQKTSEDVGLTTTEMQKILESILTTIETSLASGEPVVIKNFGRFEIRERRAAVRRNPRSGEEVKVPNRRSILFHPANRFKKNVQDETDA